MYSRNATGRIPTHFNSLIHYFQTSKLRFRAAWLGFDGLTREAVLAEPSRRVDESHLRATREGRYTNLASFFSPLLSEPPAQHNLALNTQSAAFTRSRPPALRRDYLIGDQFREEIDIHFLFSRSLNICSAHTRCTQPLQ